LKIEVKQGDGLKREVSVEVPAETVQAEMEAKFAEVRRDSTLKGFRRGKAPMAMIKSVYIDEVRAEVVDKLIKDTFRSAVREKNLKVASPPSVTDLDLTDDLVLTYTAAIEVFPEIEKVDFDNFEIADIPVEVTDKEVDDFVDHLRHQYSELRPVDREAQTGDVIIADLHKVADEQQALPETEFADSHIDLGNPLTIKEFNEQLPGVKGGQEKEVQVVYADDYPDTKFAGARITYRTKVKSVNERLLPELDDSLAKRTGQAETALELKLKIRENIQRQKDENIHRLHKRDVMRQVVEKNPVPIPEAMVESYLDAVVEEMKGGGHEDVSEQDIRTRYRPAGLETIRWDFLWHTLAEQQKIEVLPEDTENWINGFAAANQTTADQARVLLTKSGRANQLRESLLEGKVLEFLISNARKVPAGEKKGNS
jgi:trigger factor